jgi:hypothetical protein
LPDRIAVARKVVARPSSTRLARLGPMSLPFSRDQFFDLFALYNTTIWPMQIGLVIVAIACVIAILAGGGQDRAIGWALASLWGWMAVAYHLVFFTRINPAAWLFGGAYLVAAWLFARHASAGTLRFTRSIDTSHVAGFVLMAYALVGYPIVARIAGQTYPTVPTFGLPCPTTIFTLGLLLLGQSPVPVALLVVPLIWSLIGTIAALDLGVTEDYGLPAAAVITVLLRRTHAARPSPTPTVHGAAG